MAGQVSWRRLVNAGLAAVAIASIVWYYAHSRPRDHFRRALIAVEQGDLAEAERLVALMSAEPDLRKQVHLVRGVILLRRGALERALEEFRQSPPLGDLRVPALRWTGECLYHLGRLAEAERLMLLWAAEDPVAAEPHRWLGAIYSDLGLIDAAMAALKEAARLDPEDHRPHRLLALLHFESHRYEDAILHYERALALFSPERQPDMVQELAYSLIQLRDYRRALATLDLAPSAARTLALRAECHLALGQSDEAREAIAKAMRMNPRELSALQLQAQVQLDAGEVDASVKTLRTALAIDPHDVTCRYRLVLAYRRLGDQQLAEDAERQLEGSKALHKRYLQLLDHARREVANAEIRKELAATAAELGKTELADFWTRAANALRAAVSTPAHDGFQVSRFHPKRRGAPHDY